VYCCWGKRSLIWRVSLESRSLCLSGLLCGGGAALVKPLLEFLWGELLAVPDVIFMGTATEGACVTSLIFWGLERGPRRLEEGPERGTCSELPRSESLCENMPR